MAIGIDIGARTTRIAVVDRKGGRWQVTGYARLPSSEILGDQAMPGRLGEALAAAGARRGAAAVSVSGRDIILKVSNYPLVPEWRLQLLIDYEVEELGERSGGDIVSAHRILAIPGRARSEHTALLALAKESTIDERVALLEEAGLRLDAAVPSPVAIGNAQAIAPSGDPQGLTLVADVGEETTDVALVHQGRVIFARNASFGGRAFVRAVAETFGVKETTARKMIVEQGSLDERSAQGEPRQAKLHGALSGPASDLAGMLRSSLKFAQAQLRASDLEVDQIVLCGGVARIPGLDRLVAQTLRMPTSVWSGEVLASEGLDTAALAALRDDGAAAATAVGLAATVAAGDRGLVSLRLLPPRIERRRHFLQHELFVMLAAGLALFAGLLWYATASNQAEIANRRAAELRREFDELHALRQSLEAAVEERARLQELRESWATVVGPARAISEALSAIRHNLPADAHLEALVMAPRAVFTDEPRIQVEGHIRESTRSVSAIYEELAGALRSQPGFRFTTTSLKHAEDGSGLSFVCQLDYIGMPDEPEE